MKLLKTPDCGRRRLPKNALKFEVDPRMSRDDVRQYLEKIYDLPVRDVRIENVMGEITWSMPLDYRYRKAMWKDEDKKMAYVFLKKDVSFTYPDIWKTDKEAEEIEKVRAEHKKDSTNSGFVNRDRDVGKWYGV
uniref:Large ribosomal subunit protein uL23m n=1 Tax=Steinernema glaseri TaxID=37863 RepID=A0A1I7XZD8_9BILA